MRHDPSYKALFSHPAAIRDLVRGFAGQWFEGGPEWAGRLDFAKVESVPTEWIDPTLRSRAKDLVWRIGFKDSEGAPEWLHVLVMLEFQSGIDKYMALRVQGYAVQLFERFRKGRQEASTDRLPPVLAVVLYNGKQDWTAATALADLVGEGTRPEPEQKAESEQGTESEKRAKPEPKFVGERYELLDMGAESAESLPAGNLVSLIMAAEQLSGADQLANLVAEAFERLVAAGQRDFLDTFLAWLELLVEGSGGEEELLKEYLEDKTMLEQMAQSGEVRTTVQERFRAWRENVRAEGDAEARAEGRVEGRVEGRAEGRVEADNRQRRLLARQAERRFGAEAGARVASLLAGIDDPERFEEVGDWIIVCQESSDLFARMERLLA